MYTESTYTGIALITPMNALTFCDVLYQISSSDEPDAMYTFATGMQLVLYIFHMLRQTSLFSFAYISRPCLHRGPFGYITYSTKVSLP